MANLRERFKEYTDKLKGLAGPSDAMEKKIASLLERATSEMWISPDWGLNMELVDLVNSNQSSATYEKLFRSMRRRLGRSNPKVQLLVLTVLETCVKNCGASMHEALGASDLWTEVVRLADPKRRVDLELQDRVLVLIEDFAASLRPQEFRKAADDLRAGGVRFPERPEGEVGLGIETEVMAAPATTTSPVAGAGVSDADQRAIQAALQDLERSESLRTGGGEVARGVPPGEDAALAAALAPASAEERLEADLKVARNAVDLLGDALGSIPADDPGAVRQEFIRDLAMQCAEARSRLTHLIESVGDGSGLEAALVLFDDLNRAQERYEGLCQASAPPALAEADRPADPLRGPPREVPHESFSSEDMLPTLVTNRTFPPPAVQQPVIPTAAADLFSGGTGSPTSAEAPKDGFAALAAGVDRGGATGGGDGFDALVMARSPTAAETAAMPPGPLAPAAPQQAAQPQQQGQQQGDQPGGDLITF